MFHDTYNDKYYVTDTLQGVQGVFDESEVIHVKGFSRDGKTGISVLEHARLTLNISLAGSRETLTRFETGGTVKGIINGRVKSDVFGYGEVQDDELRALARKMDSSFRGGENIFPLNDGLSFQQVSLSSADMQFLQMQQFNVRDVCRFFGVHPSFVFDDTNNNYKSAEMANVAFLSNTLNPLLRKIECELGRKLVAPSLSGKRKFQFDRRGLYACDLASLSKYQADTIGTGLYTVNEWRREENKAPVPGGDEVLVSANLKSIRELTGAMYNPNNEHS